jgi:hypothetical protein
MITGSRQWHAAFGRLLKMLKAAEHAGDTDRAHKLRLSIRNFKNDHRGQGSEPQPRAGRASRRQKPIVENE